VNNRCGDGRPTGYFGTEIHADKAKMTNTMTAEFGQR